MISKTILLKSGYKKISVSTHREEKRIIKHTTFKKTLDANRGIDVIVDHHDWEIDDSLSFRFHKSEQGKFNPTLWMILDDLDEKNVSLKAVEKYILNTLKALDEVKL